MMSMPEVCYYCREQMKFEEANYHDGHYAHKKCLPTEFKKAAEQAASDIWTEYDTYVSGDTMVEIIVKHFSALESTFEKLKKLLEWCEQNIDYTDPEVNYDEFKRIVDDPAVVALLKGESPDEV